MHYDREKKVLTAHYPQGRFNEVLKHLRATITDPTVRIILIPESLRNRRGFKIESNYNLPDLDPSPKSGR